MDLFDMFKLWGGLGSAIPEGGIKCNERLFNVSFDYKILFSWDNIDVSGPCFTYPDDFEGDLGVVYRETEKPLFRVANGSKLEKGQYCISEDANPKCIFSNEDDGSELEIRYFSLKTKDDVYAERNKSIAKAKMKIKESMTTILSKTAIIDNQRVCVVLNDSRRFDTFKDYLEEVIEIINKEYTDFNDAHAELMPCKMLDLPFYKISNSTIRFKNGSTIKLVDKDGWHDLIGVRFDNAFISSNIKYGYKDKDNVALCLSMSIYQGGNEDGCVRTLDGI